MTNPIAINGTFADLKSVKTRSVVQIVVEVPIEQAAKVVELFGFPQPGAEIPVTVFRPAPAPASQAPAGKLVVPKPRRHWDDLPASQQAALACKEDAAFREWLYIQYGGYIGPPGNVPACPDLLRSVLGIHSRAELDNDADKAKAWRSLYDDFRHWAGRVPTPR